MIRWERDECDDVRKFHAKFGQLAPTEITHLTRRKLYERIRFLTEELAEFTEAAGLPVVASRLKEAVQREFEDINHAYGDPQNQDMATMFDSLLDLVYVAKGTAVMMGLDYIWPEGWSDVQRANMAKVRGQTHRGNLYDVAKPEGWVGPQTDTILALGNYQPGAFLVDGVVDDSKCLDDEPYMTKEES